MSLSQDKLLEAPHNIYLENGPDRDDLESTKDKAVQVMQVELARDVVRDMKKCARGGQGLSLGFGQHLILRYGHTSKPLRATSSILRQELYEGSTAGGTLDEEKLQFAGLISHYIAIHKPDEKSAAEISASETALNKMREQYAALRQVKQDNQSTIVENVVGPAKKRGMVNSVNRRPLQYNGQNLSRPTSKLLSSPHSQAFQPASQKPSQASRMAESSASARAQRHVLIHLLAIRRSTFESIRERTGIPDESLGLLLDQLCERSGTGSKSFWSLSSRRFKELDIWQFPYVSDLDRQDAIENAISALDKQRINPQDDIWQKLLPLGQRNNGKILSRLHLIAGDHRKLLKNVEGKESPGPTSPTPHHQSEVMAKDSQVTSEKPKGVKKDLIKKGNSAAASTVKKQAQSQSNYLSSERIEDSDEDFEAAVASSTNTGLLRAASPELKSIKKDKPDNLTSSTTKRKAEENAKKHPVPAKKVKSEAQFSTKTKVNQHTQTTTAVKAESHQPTAAHQKPATQTVPTASKRKAEDEAKKDVSGSTKPNNMSDLNGTTSFGSKRVKANNGTAVNTPQATSAPAKSKPSLTDIHKSNSAAPRLSATSATATKHSVAHPVVEKPRDTSLLAKKPQSQASSASKPAQAKTQNHDQPTKKLKEVAATPQSATSTPRKPEQVTKQTAAKDKPPGEHAPVPASTTSLVPTAISKALLTYKQYYTDFQAFKAFRKSFIISATNRNPPPAELLGISQKYRHLERMQKSILAGFESRVAEFGRPFQGTVRKDDNIKIMNAGEAKALREECRARYVDWKTKYLAMRDKRGFGEMLPADMERMWTELAVIGKRQRMVVRSLALGFGSKETGELEQIGLEKFS